MFSIDNNIFNLCEICNDFVTYKSLIDNKKLTCNKCNYCLYFHNYSGLDLIKFIKDKNVYCIWEDLHYHKNGKEKFGFSINGEEILFDITPEIKSINSIKNLIVLVDKLINNTLFL